MSRVDREDTNKRPRWRPKLSIVNLLLFAGFVGLFVAPVVSSFLRQQAQGRLSACSKSSLHSIGTALEMYARDFDGHYPAELSDLKPNYLRQIPICPENETSYNDTYQTGRVGYNKDGQLDDYYILSCKHGHPRLGLPAGYPQYDPRMGLIDYYSPEPESD